ncbi:hypothetical protein SRHO_G00345790 [Serrasalmus rhombeus]
MRRTLQPTQVAQCLEPEPERSSSPGSNSDVPPSQLKATSEITPGSADDMCLSSRPLERPVVVQVHSDSHLQRQSVFGRLLHVLRREQGLQRSTGEGRGHSLTNVCQLGVLILHVMRFDMLDYGEKLKDRMDIPAQLDLSDFPGVASLGKQSSGSTSFQASPRSSLRPGVSTHRPLQTAWCCVSFGEQLGQRGAGENSSRVPLNSKTTMPGENFTKEPKEVLHARSSIHSHSQLATQSKPAHFSTFEFNVQHSIQVQVHSSSTLSTGQKQLTCSSACSGAGEKNNMAFWMWDHGPVTMCP